MKTSLKYMPKGFKIGFVLLLIGNIILFLTGLILIIVSTSTTVNNDDCSDPIIDSLFLPEKIELSNGRANYDANSKHFELRSRNKPSVLKGRLGLKVDNDFLKDISIKKYSTKDMEIKFIHKLPSYLVSNTTLRITNEQIVKNNNYEINCDRHDWSFDVRLEDQNQEFEDCFKLEGAYWYGGAESYLQQYWPINNQTYLPHKPYLTGLFGISSSVLERYWISSNGIAIVVNQSIPLFVSMNKTDICFLANAKYPYSKHQIMRLAYDVCTIEHDPSSVTFLKDLQLEMIKRYFATPIGIPDELMFKRPIWSTWAAFKRDINESVVLDFAKEINDNGYPNCQLEIDDKWQTRYGDFEFDPEKFPNAKELISELRDLGFRSTVWIHPFANVDSQTFLDKAFEFYWVRAPDALHPAFTAW
jgi:alpha-glucosidase (family GH31 glycosyl hydrolase)